MAYAVCSILFMLSILFFIYYLKSSSGWIETQGTLVPQKKCMSYVKWSGTQPIVQVETSSPSPPCHVIYTTIDRTNYCVPYPLSSSPSCDGHQSPPNNNVTIWYDATNPQHITTMNLKKVFLIVASIMLSITILKFLLAYYCNWWCCLTFYSLLGKSLIGYGPLGPFLYCFAFIIAATLLVIIIVNELILLTKR